MWRLVLCCFFNRSVYGVDEFDLQGSERVRRPQRLPTVLSHEEVAALLFQLDGVYRLIGLLLYGSGLRLQECFSLRVKDVKLDERQIAVRQGKRRVLRLGSAPIWIGSKDARR